ncbi:MAG: hypothetical protein LBP79_01790 [Clostridiales bacterium]|jgi:hypothetical protein|nr:hypothetical protein [Clostridiales bacterium]
MKKLYEARLLIYSFGLLISSTIERVITSAINNRFNLPEAVYHLVSLIILILLFLFTNIIIKKIITSTFVIKNVFKNEYVGGRWIEVIYGNKDKTKIIGFTLLDVRYSDDRITVSGKNFDVDFRHNHDFIADSADMSEYNLSYVFKSRDDNKISVGYGSLNFIKPSKGSPKSYMAHFIDDDEDRWADGYIVSERTSLESIDASVTEGMREVLRGKNLIK